MKVIDVEEKFPPFDCSSGEAQAWLSTGKYKQFIPLNKPRKQNLTFVAREGRRFQSVWDAPFIIFSCSTCGNKGTITGPSCHKTQQIRCCGVSTPIPADIAAEYAALRLAWEPKHKKYTEAIRKNEQEKERIRKEVEAADNRRLVMKLGPQST